jgi:hypothetical protein
VFFVVQADGGILPNLFYKISTKICQGLVTYSPFRYLNVFTKAGSNTYVVRFGQSFVYSLQLHVTCFSHPEVVTQKFPPVQYLQL